MVLTLAENTPFSPKVIGIDGNTPIFLKVLTIDGIDGLMGFVNSVISVRGIRDKSRDMPRDMSEGATRLPVTTPIKNCYLSPYPLYLFYFPLI